MNKRWKGLAALVAAGALVLAPLVTAGAVADELPPDDTAVVAVEPTEPVAEPVAEPAAEPVAEPAAEPAAEPVTPEPVVADDSQDIPDAEPVAEPEPEPAVEEEPVTPQGGHHNPCDYQSFGSGGYVKCVTPTLTWTDPTCDEPGVLTLGQDKGYGWIAVLNDDGSTTYTASPVWGYAFPSDAQVEWTVPDLSVLDGDECADSPPVVTIVPDCENEQGNILVTVVSDNDGDVQVTLYLDFNGDGTPDASEVLTVVPGTTVLHYNFGEDVAVGIGVYFEGAPIFQEVVTADCEPNYVPVPALFNAEPEPPTCDTAGSFDFGYDPFPNVEVTISPEPAGPGTYVLTATAINGAVFGDGSTVIERTIVVEEAIGFQSTDAEAPCYLAPPLETTLGQPRIVDECGTANDFGYTPDDTATVTYEWVDANDPDNWDIYAYVADGYTVVGNTDGWTQVPDENIWVYTWVPLPQFSDEACENEPPTPPVPPTKVTPPPLAATGNGVNYLPWAGGALAGMLAGISLIAFRKVLARR